MVRKGQLTKTGSKTDRKIPGISYKNLTTPYTDYSLNQKHHLV